MFGWTAAQIPFLLLLPALLVLSGFFSGSETALFSLSQPERMAMRRTHPAASTIIDRLLAHPRMLLITVLFANMTVNVFYFVISSVLMMQAETGIIGELLLGVISLLLLILFGEVIPKMVANGQRLLVSRLISGPLYAVHSIIAPIRVMLDIFVVGPLSRLTTPEAPPPTLLAEELGELLEVSSDRGVISAEEHAVLEGVIELSRHFVRDVMTPRVQLIAVPLSAKREEVVRIAETTRLTRLPVFGRDLDDIRGILHVKRYLLDPKSSATPVGALMSPVRFVPEVATLDRLLEELRRNRMQSAIVVDEYGGTAGIVSIGDVVSELVGELLPRDQRDAEVVKQIDDDTWRIGGEVALRDLSDIVMQIDPPSPRISTFNGLVTDRLGRAPAVGDEVEFDRFRVTVERVERMRIITAKLTRFIQPTDTEHPADLPDEEPAP